MAKERKIKVVQDEEKPVPVEVLATSIRDISRGMQKLRQGPLNERCLELLIQHAAGTTGYPQRKPTLAEVRAILDGIENLERAYLRKRSA